MQRTTARGRASDFSTFEVERRKKLSTVSFDVGLQSTIHLHMNPGIKVKIRYFSMRDPRNVLDSSHKYYRPSQLRVELRNSRLPEGRLHQLVSRRTIWVRRRRLRREGSARSRRQLPVVRRVLHWRQCTQVRLHVQSRAGPGGRLRL